MTNFTKENLTIHSDTVMYGDQFVMRNKHHRAAQRGMITFLIKNFTVEEYFGLRGTGHMPLTILESKGYILPHIKKWLKEAGLPLTLAGKSELIRRSMKKD
jgi:hypothetical protein